MRGLRSYRVVILTLLLLFWGTVHAQLPKKPQLMENLRLVANDSIRVYAVASTKKVFSYKPIYNSKNVESIQLSAAKNETEQFQLVLTPKRDINDVRLEFKFKSGPTKKESNVWKYWRIGEIKVPRSSYWYGIRGNESGLVPDPLYGNEPFTVDQGKNTALLLKFQTDDEFKSGRYKYQIEILAEDKRIATVNVCVNIWNITLPKEKGFATIGCDYKYSKDSYEFLKQQGVTDLKYGTRPPSISFDTTGKHIAAVDFSPVSEDAKIAINDVGIKNICLGPKLLGQINQLGKDYLNSGYAVNSPEFWELFREYLVECRKFYVGNGWADNLIFYMMDEIQESLNPVAAKIAELSKEYFPEMKTAIVAEKPSNELLENIDIWVVPWHFFVTSKKDIPRWDELRERGVKLYAYMNSLYMVNHPDILSGNRFYPSVLAKYGYKGNLWWALRIYPNNKIDPWKEAISWYGSKNNKWFYGNGYLFYPPLKKGDNYHSSLRWESYRQGTEDYDLLMLLKKKYADKIAELGVAKKITDDQLIRMWGTMLSDGFRVQNYRKDGEFILRFRQLLANEIENITKKPSGLFYYGVDGWETDSDTLPVKGFVSANTKVFINGVAVKEFNSREDYEFIQNVPLNKGENIIEIRLLNDGRKNVFYRLINKKARNK